MPDKVEIYTMDLFTGDPRDRFEKLLEKYQEKDISLHSFQNMLQSLLGSFDYLSKENEEFIINTINRIEEIIYTISDKDEQKDEIAELVPIIREYLQIKADANDI